MTDLITSFCHSPIPAWYKFDTCLVKVNNHFRNDRILFDNTSLSVNASLSNFFKIALKNLNTIVALHIRCITEMAKTVVNSICPPFAIRSELW